MHDTLGIWWDMIMDLNRYHFDIFLSYMTSENGVIFPGGVGGLTNPFVLFGHVLVHYK